MSLAGMAFPINLTPTKKDRSYNKQYLHWRFTCKSNLFLVYVPMIVEAWATPTIHTPLFASAAISPVTDVPWLFENELRKLASNTI